MRRVVGRVDWPALVVAGLLSAACSCRAVDDIEPPRLSVRDVSVRQYSAGRARLGLLLAIDNPNPFAVSLVGVSGIMTLDEAVLPALQWSGRQPLGASQMSQCSIQVDVEVGEHAPVVAALVDRRPLRYRFDGDLLLARGVISRELAVEAGGALNDDAAPAPGPAAPPK